MQTLNLKIAIPHDHWISLELPKEIPPGPAEILVIIQPQASPLTIADLGWSPEKAAAVRAQLASFVEDWDDPRMDVYNGL
jgi:hypothetical protein